MQTLMPGSGMPSSGLTPAFQMGGPRSVQLDLRVFFGSEVSGKYRGLDLT